MKTQAVQSLIPYIYNKIITVFESSLFSLYAVFKMSQKLPHLNFPMGEGLKSSYMLGLDNTGSGLNLVTMKYHQSVAEFHPNLVSKFTYLKDMDDVEPFDISGVDVVKEDEQGKVGVYFTVVITYKIPFVVKAQSVTVSIALG